MFTQNRKSFQNQKSEIGNQKFEMGSLFLCLLKIWNHFKIRNRKSEIRDLKWDPPYFCALFEIRNQKSEILLLSDLISVLCDRDQQSDDLITFLIYLIKIILAQKITFSQKFKPVCSLIGLFQSNSHFCIKIGVTMSAMCFTNISSDACSAPEDLSGHDILMFFFRERSVQTNDTDRELFAFIDYGVFFMFPPIH